jgi:hypothetical protein
MMKEPNARRTTGAATTANCGGGNQCRTVAGLEAGAVTAEPSARHITTTKEGRGRTSGSALVLVRDNIRGWPAFNAVTMPAVSRFLALYEARCFAEPGTPQHRALGRRIARAERFAREVAV